MKTFICLLLTLCAIPLLAQVPPYIHSPMTTNQTTGAPTDGLVPVYYVADGSWHFLQVVTNYYAVGLTNSGLWYGPLNLGTNGSQFTLRDDSARITALAVAVFRPLPTNSAMILDLMPTGDNSVTNTQTPFLTGIDLVNRNLSIVVDNTNFTVARIALKPGVVILGSSAGGTNDAPLVIFQAGTNNARPFSWVFQSTGNSGNVTQMWVNASGSLSVSNGLVGTTFADNALPGVIGEYTNKLIVFAGATNMNNNVNTNLLSFTLSAGDWDVEGAAIFASSVAATVTQEKAGITTVANVVPNDGTQVYSTPGVTNLAFTDGITIPRQRFNINTPTTIFMVGNATFSQGSVVGYGQMSARRVR